MLARSRVAAVLDSLPSIHKIDQVAISPDGTQVAYIVEGALMVAPVAGGSEHRMPSEKAVREVAWSGDSKSVAWLADLAGETPASELWMAGADGSGAAKFADFKGYAQTVRFAPDGSQVGVLYIEGMPRVAGPLQPMTPLAGVVGEKVYEQRLTTVDLRSKAIKQVTPADVYIYEYDWAPDSKGWAAIAAHGAGDNNWWIARLYRIDAADGQLHEIYKPKWQIADPHVSPDGKNVAFIEGLMSDEGLTGGDIFVVPLAGGAAKNLIPKIGASVSALTWDSPEGLAYLANRDGAPAMGWAKLSPSTHEWGSPALRFAGAVGTSSDPWVPSASFSPDGKSLAFVSQSASTPPEIFAGTMLKWKQITHINDGVKPTWGEARNVHWMNGDTRVQGWLMMPSNYDPAKRYPLVVSVHGGPSWGCMNTWPGNTMGSMAGASALGWFVLCPNPRGSYGQGEAFTQGNVKDFGGGDYRDIMAGVDAMVKQFPIDPKRIGIRGHSYGGYMTMWAETQTNKFAAAVAGAGLSHWTSYYGLNDIDEWMIPFFGASVYDDPAVYAKSDPIRFVKNVKTPTLILVGDGDGEVPMAQSIEWYHALKTFKVPTQLVVYPNEGHVFYKPADARDYTERMLEWFDQWFAKAGQ
ncbi:MAG: prolyl oligopeptidase family serine peptidase [Terriglobales bacterium]